MKKQQKKKSRRTAGKTSRKRVTKTGFNYYAFFVTGLLFLVGGVFIKDMAILCLGIAFSALGFMNRDNWGKQKKWNELTEDEKNIKVVLMTGVFLSMFLCNLAFFFA
jgi:hypothetical protein